MFITLNAFGCPKIKGILIDACGTNEERNEWMVLTTDVSVSVNSLIIDYDVNNNSGGSSNADIGSGGCTWITPRTSSMDAIKLNTVDGAIGGIFNDGGDVKIFTSDAAGSISLIGSSFSARSATFELASIGGTPSITNRGFAGSQNYTSYITDLDYTQKIYVDTHIAFTPIPTSSTDPGIKGQMAVDATYLYICVDTDTWTRVALAW